MAKEFYVELGGKSRRLAYRVRDGIELKRRFGRPLISLLREDVMGMRERPDPDKPGETLWEAVNATDPEVQVAFLYVGVRHEGGVNEDKVLNWVDAHLSDGKPMGDLVGPVWKAVFISGVLGYSLDIEAEAEKLKDDEAGKDRPAGTTPPEAAA
jgi:hypothetical protein